MNDISRVVLKEILKKDYVLSDSVINDPKFLTISLHTKSKDRLLPLFTHLMLSRGYMIEQKNNVFFIDSLVKVEPDQLVFSYTPRYRDVSYLLQSISNVFDDAKFSKPLNVTRDQDNIFESDQLLFKGTEKQIRSLTSVLDQLDSKESQVQINAHLYEVSNNDKKESAFSLALNILGRALNVNFAAQALANVLTFKSSDVSLAFSALNSDTRFNSISSPTLLVKHAARGKISVGADVPVLSNVSFQNNGQAVQSIEYKPSGVILDITPRFHQDNIELTINHQLSSFVATQNGVNNSPTLIKREFNTVINANHNDLIIIGGLTEKRLSKSRAYVPVLPFLANSRTAEKIDSEILLVLHVTKL